VTTDPRHSNKQSTPRRKGLHPRNCHQSGYDFPALVSSWPALSAYVKTNIHGKVSIDFANPLAVNALNTALLKRHYNIVDWHIPEGALCPPIPGRADYIHYIAELLGINDTTISLSPVKSNISLLDIGTGANGIYPILACQIYGWHCVGSDINKQSLDNVEAIISNNDSLKNVFKLRLQDDKNHIFNGIIQTGEYFDVTVCNPPFHASLEEALKGNQRKVDNLARNRGEQSNKTRSSTHTLNFGGLEAELWCNGGEKLFLKKMIKESQDFAAQCRWFTSLVSKSDNVKPSIKLLRKLGATDIREIEMAQGNKITRILAWTYS
jgi:23S rRNA (adenine1618-N6)-methyltransferase